MADKIQALVGNNPMIKSVMSNPEHMAKAQEMLRNPEMQKQIGGVISNPAVIKQASEVLNGLQQMNTQTGGRKRRTRRKRKRKRRKRTKKKRRKKSRRRRKRGKGWGNFRNRIGNSGTKTAGEKCTRKAIGSECAPGLICQDNDGTGHKCIDKKDSKFFYRTGKFVSTAGQFVPNPRNWRLLTGGKRKKTRRRRKRR